MVEDKDVQVVVDPNTRRKPTCVNGQNVTDEDNTPTYMLNKLGRAYTTPRFRADEQIRSGEAMEVTPDMPDYVELVKKALGRWDGFKAGETIQSGGKWKAPSEIGKFDIEAKIEQAKADAEKYGPKDDGKIVIAKDLPTGSADFDARLRKKKFGR